MFSTSGLVCGGAGLARRAALLLFLGAAGGLLPVRSQTTAISNLLQTPTLSVTTHTGNYTAINFTTGATAYDFASVTVPLNAFGPTLGGFAFSLYSGSAGSGPSSLLRSLVGTVPTSSTYSSFTYTPATPLTLSVSTNYWLVMVAPTTDYDSQYGWNAISVTTEDGGGLPGWSIGNSRWVSSNAGVSWNTPGGTNVPQISVAVTAVPEPAATAIVYAAVGVGLACLRWPRRVARQGVGGSDGSMNRGSDLNV